ncbi:MAG: molybdenum cofactor guanylyltransferase [Candidatus Krumholzibacteriia bacterium]
MTNTNPDDRRGALPVYILAGGKSRRFGNDKARAMVDGAPLITRVSQVFASVAGEVTVVADRAGRYADLGLRTIGDVVPEKGPIGGLLTALDDAGGWIFLTACDWLGVRPEWLQTLDETRARSPRETGAVVFRSERGYEPLFGLYSASMRAAISAEIDRGRLKMQDLLGRIGTVAVDMPAGWRDVVNLNRPVD